jgi:hypothetical protein
MTDYIVSDIEMAKIFKEGLFLDEMRDWFKNHQPITKVAEGKVYDDILEYEAQFLIGDKDLLTLFKIYDGKHIEIYIKESK